MALYLLFYKYSIIAFYVFLWQYSDFYEGLTTCSWSGSRWRLQSRCSRLLQVSHLVLITNPLSVWKLSFRGQTWPSDYIHDLQGTDVVLQGTDVTFRGQTWPSDYIRDFQGTDVTSTGPWKWSLYLKPFFVPSPSSLSFFPTSSSHHSGRLGVRPASGDWAPPAGWAEGRAAARRGAGGHRRNRQRREEQPPQRAV